MSYTNSDLVKKHFVFRDTLTLDQRDIPVFMEGVDWLDLAGGGIALGSLKVRAKREFAPVMERLSLVEAGAPLSSQQLVPGSIIVASDDSLGTIYRENTDYYFDYVGGLLKRIAGGEILEGAEVVIWYYRYHLYEEGSDYTVEYERGRIRRLSGGDIRPGQQVFLDYDIPSDILADSVYAQAAEEADAVIEKELDSSQTFGADPTLQTAATFLAASIVCRIAAAAGRTVSGAARTDWLSLGESYRRDYENLIRTFRPQAARFNPPTHS